MSLPFNTTSQSPNMFSLNDMLSLLCFACSAALNAFLFQVLFYSSFETACMQNILQPEALQVYTKNTYFCIYLILILMLEGRMNKPSMFPFPLSLKFWIFLKYPF